MLDLCADAGIRWYRFDLDWRETEPRRGAFEWRTADRIVDWASGRGLSLLAVLAYAPEWAWAHGERRRDAHDQGQVPADVADWTRFVQAVVGRYGPRIHAYSLWNEPNVKRFWHGSRDEYLRRILAPGLGAVRAADVNAVVAGPDLASSPSQGRPETWLQQVLGSGLRFDVLTHHQYDGRDEVGGRVRELEKVYGVAAREHPPAPFWVTEIGFRLGSETPTRDSQADALAAVMHAMYARPWWDKTFWYDTHGDGWGLFEGEDKAPCPALGRYREIARRGRLAAERTRRLAQALLGRPPSPAESRAWRGDSFTSPASLVGRVAASEEAARLLSALSPEDLAAHLYQTILGRAPDEEGFAATVAALRDGRLADRVEAMFGSDEFARQIGEAQPAQQAY